MRSLSTVSETVSSSILRGVFVLVAGLMIVACANAEEPMRLAVHSERLIVTSSDGLELAQFDIEVAETEEQRSAGLMFRTDLPKERGMLFVFPETSQRFFWMQNTPTPLDIIYADDIGTVVRIAENTTPFSTATIPSNTPARYAFEIHAGLSRQLGIKEGAQLGHPVIKKK